MISAETIAAVRERADIASVVGETVKLVRRGRSLLGLCPFHKEKTPSFHVNPENGFYYCFGCHEKGDAIGFVMKTEGLDFTEAVRVLADRLGIQIDERDASQYAAQRAARKASQDLYDVNGIAAAFFEEQLRVHSTARVAREELARRELRSSAPTDLVADALQSFRVGYAPSGWDALTSHLARLGVSPVAAESLGLLVPRKGSSGYYDRFRNRLMFAVLDSQGRVVAFSGRVLPDPETGQVDKETGKYINSPESPIYRKGEIVFGLYQARQAIREADQALVVEGNFDVVSLHARGIRNVVAPLGTAFTSAQARLIRRFTQRVILLFDGDNAGRQAAKKSKEPCKEAGLDARVGKLPEGMDPDDFVRKDGKEAIDRLVSSSVGMLEHLISLELDRGFTLGDAKERASRVQEVARLLSEEADPTLRAMAQVYADRIAARLGIHDATTFRAVHATVRRALTPGGSERGQEMRDMAPDKARAHPKEDDIPLKMLGCVLDWPELLDDPEIQQASGILEGEIALAVGLARNLRGNKSLYTDTFLAHLPQSIHDFALRRLCDRTHIEMDIARLEFLQNAQKLKQRELAREHARVTEKVGHAWESGDVKAEDALLLEAQRRAREKLGL
jgi:DNA primase